MLTSNFRWEWWFTTLWMVVVLAGCAPAPVKETPMFLARSVEIDGRSFDFRVFVPTAPASGPRPVLLFLHGSGERGRDNLRQTQVGLGPVLARQAATFPAIVVMPQVPEDGRWSGEMADVAMRALAQASAEFGGDPDRTYLTGLSMGGYGAWQLALAHPGRFAAVVPVCGGLFDPLVPRPAGADGVDGDAAAHAAAGAALRDLPIWVFHGARDDVVPVERSRRMVAALRAAGAAPRYTEFPEANHNAWDPAYAEPGLWPWLFAQSRRRG